MISDATLRTLVVFFFPSPFSMTFGLCRGVLKDKARCRQKQDLYSARYVTRNKSRGRDRHRMDRKEEGNKHLEGNSGGTGLGHGACVRACSLQSFDRYLGKCYLHVYTSYRFYGTDLFFPFFFW